ncbi:preprotein translocase subunit SecG [Candidatus Berkelbacteria bacterium CG06_land_8_20_14_3_00_43_10]|uniref:Protein-export membrane protein SecG n=1 Tax=Candidatus Berkelbacteria bacterium CG10_big_fil_rev_8_21_14_0_10_43_14 TaxID=1974515 RepID=A0A2M6R944_9BACT|nr:MAG: preprotein translocase subunit SecG [Candidatus Berkelbacteria bacterium CG2_30_43_20]PIS06580.1 MAG: preprotein translocase subunit SecG [Candidatus Berkelbacteria bacterium CG10_big_fil_rev_8_21_14_0_10_43_14]PIU87326.1 MAG: preprotein translocase subunit SecG [Candidatus Berkelbacteria bacterium CG06_land_8_20_14_3_00_43_10]
MQKIITICLVVISLLLIASILLQQRGASLGGAFGGDSSIYRSRRGAEKILFRLTILFALSFIVISIIAVLEF